MATNTVTCAEVAVVLGFGTTDRDVVRMAANLELATDAPHWSGQPALTEKDAATLTRAAEERDREIKENSRRNWALNADAKQFQQNIANTYAAKYREALGGRDTPSRRDKACKAASKAAAKFEATCPDELRPRIIPRYFDTWEDADKGAFRRLAERGLS